MMTAYSLERLKSIKLFLYFYLFFNSVIPIERKVRFAFTYLSSHYGTNIRRYSKPLSFQSDHDHSGHGNQHADDPVIVDEVPGSTPKVI